MRNLRSKWSASYTKLDKLPDRCSVPRIAWAALLTRSGLPSTGNRARSERGAALIELALTLPVLLLVVTGISVFGIAFNNYLSLTEGVSVGARLLAISRGQTTDPCALTATAIYNAAPSLTKSNYGFTFVLNGTTYAGATCSSSSTSTGAAGNLVQGQPAEVIATYPCSLGVYGGGLSSTCVLKAQTTELVQ